MGSVKLFPFQQRVASLDLPPSIVLDGLSFCIISKTYVTITTRVQIHDKEKFVWSYRRSYTTILLPVVLYCHRLCMKTNIHWTLKEVRKELPTEKRRHLKRRKWKLEPINPPSLLLLMIAGNVSNMKVNILISIPNLLKSNASCIITYHHCSSKR